MVDTQTENVIWAQKAAQYAQCLNLPTAENEFYEGDNRATTFVGGGFKSFYIIPSRYPKMLKYEGFRKYIKHLAKLNIPPPRLVHYKNLGTESSH